MTKEERAEYQKKYRNEHRAEINEYRRLHYQRNKEKIREQQKKFYEAHKNDPKYKAQACQAMAKYRNKNRERYNAYYRERYRKKQLERILAERSGQ